MARKLSRYAIRRRKAARKEALQIAGIIAAFPIVTAAALVLFLPVDGLALYVRAFGF